MDEISNSMDIIDSRDIIERINELEELITENNKLEDDEKEDLCEEEEELRILTDLKDQAGSFSDWQYGETLIRDFYFVEYVEELCKDIGYIAQDFPWWIEIDWDATAEHVKADYISVDFDGEEYWIRS